ncbi:Wzz/FepE/Etk N-terminal domain-containing protein [Sphingomonas sp. UYP23]
MDVENSLRFEPTKATSQSRVSALIKKRKWFFVFVILPTILAAIYYLFIASDVYISEARFVVKSADQKRPQLSTLANLIQTTGLSAGQEQANEILEFVRSRNAVAALERDPGLRQRYSAPGIDFISRFPHLGSGNTFEDLYRYYTNMVSAKLDGETGTAILTIKAYSARDAYEINKKLLELSEGMVNRLNTRAQTRGISEAQKQVAIAMERTKEARAALAQFRNSQDIIDPTKQATGVLEISNKMVAERASLAAQLASIQRSAPSNPSIPAIRSRIAAISAQIASQNGRVVGAGGSISSKLGGYENLQVEQEFATENLNVASAALVQARNEGQRQQFYLEHVVDPNLPDMPLLPRRLIDIIVVAAAATFLYFIGWMVIVGILEHAPEE